MWIIYGTRKDTKERKELCRRETEEQAERFCEMWGWIYGDGKHSYWLDLEEEKRRNRPSGRILGRY